MTIQEVIDKRFKDEKMLYFQSSDALKNLEGDTYLTYRKNGNKVELYFGGDSGEVCIYVTYNPEKLETLIKELIY